jgi:hypothetical protein
MVRFDPDPADKQKIWDYVQLMRTFLGGERDLIHWLGLISPPASSV